MTSERARGAFSGYPILFLTIVLAIATIAVFVQAIRYEAPLWLLGTAALLLATVFCEASACSS